MVQTEDSLEMKDFVEFDGMHAILEERLGGYAPTKSTLRSWAKASVRDRNPVLRAHLPRPRKILGDRRGLYLRRDCDEFADAILRDAETRTFDAA